MDDDDGDTCSVAKQIQFLTSKFFHRKIDLVSCCEHNAKLEKSASYKTSYNMQFCSACSNSKIYTFCLPVLRFKSRRFSCQFSWWWNAGSRVRCWISAETLWKPGWLLPLHCCTDSLWGWVMQHQSIWSLVLLPLEGTAVALWLRNWNALGEPWVPVSWLPPMWLIGSIWPTSFPCSTCGHIWPLQQRRAWRQKACLSAST